MKSLLRKKTILSCIIAVFLFAGITAFGGKVSHKRHPNLAAAQTLIEKAVNKVSAAQAANEFDMEGHAAKAKALLDQAYAEIKLAAVTANKK
ncbi:MAG TPA: hypothetical protein VLX91_00755 [Candidatus Acidoferrales bacterium]|nr:hypothetical protein [Candidatus Acidoferrales bacterium]